MAGGAMPPSESKSYERGSDAPPLPKSTLTETPLADVPPPLLDALRPDFSEPDSHLPTRLRAAVDECTAGEDAAHGSGYERVQQTVLGRRQALLSQLQNDLEACSVAYRRCEALLQQERARNRQLQSELEESRMETIARERAMDAATETLAEDATNMSCIDLSELQRRHRLLGAAQNAYRRRAEECAREAAEVRAELSQLQGEYSQLQGEYSHLKKAHKQQASLLQKAQATAAKSDSYRATAMKQEVIIRKLEKLLAGALREGKRARERESPELAALKQRLQRASEHAVKLLARAESAERRAAAVEDGMLEGNRLSACEIARLKLIVAEKEAQLGMIRAASAPQSRSLLQQTNDCGCTFGFGAAPSTSEASSSTTTGLVRAVHDSE